MTSSTLTSQSKHTEAKGTNSKFIVLRTSNGKSIVPNPDYDPHKCDKCGKKKGLFHRC